MVILNKIQRVLDRCNQIDVNVEISYNRVIYTCTTHLTKEYTSLITFKWIAIEYFALGRRLGAKPVVHYCQGSANQYATHLYVGPKHNTRIMWHL